MKPRVVVQNSSTQEAEAGGEPEFEASLGDIARPYFKKPTRTRQTKTQREVLDELCVFNLWK